MNTRHKNLKLTFDFEQNNGLSFLGVRLPVEVNDFLFQFLKFSFGS